MAKLIYEALGELRQERGLSRSVLSRRTAREGDEGISEGAIERLETTPGSMPTARVLEALARALGVEPDYFYEWPIAKAAAERPAKPSVTERARKAAQRLDDTQPTSRRTRRAQGDEGRGA